MGLMVLFDIKFAMLLSISGAAIAINRDMLFLVSNPPLFKQGDEIIKAIRKDEVPMIHR